MRGAIEYLMKHPELLETLPKEMLQQLMEWVKAEKAKGRSAMPERHPDPNNIIADSVTGGVSVSRACLILTASYNESCSRIEACHLTISFFTAPCGQLSFNTG
jgi:hypothetical protein